MGWWGRLEDDEEGIVHKEDSQDIKGSVKTDSQGRPFRLVIVEPILVLFFVSVMGGHPLISQYLYSIMAEKYNLTTSGGHANHDNGSCDRVDTNSSVFDAQQAAQAEAAHWNLYLSMCVMIPNIIVSFILGPFSDVNGRKLAMILPIVGTTMNYILIIMGILLDQRLPFLLLGGLVEGASGGIITILVACNAYIADMTSHDKRVRRMTIADVCFGLVGSASAIAIGYAIKYIGFLNSMVIIIGTLLINLVYVIFFVPESVKRSKNNTGPVSFSLVSKTMTVFTKVERTDRRWKLVFGLFTSILVNIAVGTTRGRLLDLYVMNTPLCWGPVLLGYYHGINSWIKEFFNMVLVLSLMRYLKEVSSYWSH